MKQGSKGIVNLSKLTFYDVYLVGNKLLHGIIQPFTA